MMLLHCIVWLPHQSWYSCGIRLLVDHKYTDSERDNGSVVDLGFQEEKGTYRQESASCVQ